MSCFRTFFDISTFISLSILLNVLTFVSLSALLSDSSLNLSTNVSSDLLSDSLSFCCFLLLWFCFDELLKMLKLKLDWLQKIILRVFFKFSSSWWFWSRIWNCCFFQSLSNLFNKFWNWWVCQIFFLAFLTDTWF